MPPVKDYSGTAEQVRRFKDRLTNPLKRPQPVQPAVTPPVVRPYLAANFATGAAIQI
jgi:hypothetical protein